jgi:hypothetical protein
MAAVRQTAAMTTLKAEKIYDEEFYYTPLMHLSKEGIS